MISRQDALGVMLLPARGSKQVLTKSIMGSGLEEGSRLPFPAIRLTLHQQSKELNKAELRALGALLFSRLIRLCAR